MRSLLGPCLLLFLALTVVTGVAYPAFVTAAAQTLWPGPANGSLIVRDGKVVGSSLIGQSFDDPKYLWGRPSATSRVPYDAASSSGSNLGPTHPDLETAVKARIAALHASDPANLDPIPVDLVTTSGSGLDPHVSPAAARWQAPRISRARGVPLQGGVRRDRPPHRARRPGLPRRGSGERAPRQPRLGRAPLTRTRFPR